MGAINRKLHRTGNCFDEIKVPWGNLKQCPLITGYDKAVIALLKPPQRRKLVLTSFYFRVYSRGTENRR
jgi:hypothetical protein